MKTKLFALLLLFFPLLAVGGETSISTAYGIPIEWSNIRICERCKNEGKKSTVQQGVSTHYAVYCGGDVWGEDGKPIERGPCGGGETSFSCSNGHAWIEKTMGGETVTTWITDKSTSTKRIYLGGQWIEIDCP